MYILAKVHRTRNPYIVKIAVERKLLIPCEDPPGPCWIYMSMLAEYSVEVMHLIIQLHLQQLQDRCIEDRTFSALHHGYCEVTVNPISVTDHLRKNFSQL